MAIEINPQTVPGSRQSGRSSETGSVNGQRSQSIVPERSGAAGEKVTFTEQSTRFQQIEAALRDQPAVDQQRVEAIRAAIADGTYQVDSGRVAKALLGLENELSGER
jgi:negative regulator of flagellin synthesis FlgM